MSEFLHKDSIGPVVPKDAHLTFENGFLFENGETLPELNIRYETYGTLNADASNVVWICSPLTADAHVAGYYTEQDKHMGWWDSLIGKGKAVDTDRFFVVCSNILGGCKGTTGPASIDQRTGKPYGSKFPKITIGDMVHAQKALADHLGVKRFYAVIGGSMGGFQAMKWAIYYPELIDHLVVIASSPRFSSQALGFEIVARDVITQDPNFNGGDYYDGKGPDMGLANARKLAHITYLSAEGMEKKFKRAADQERHSHATDAYKTPFDMDLPLESYLRYQGAKFVERFDANSYLLIAHATDTFDLETEYGSLENAFKDIKCDVLNINLSSDWLFPPHESRKLTDAFLAAGKQVTSLEYDTAFGHDGFLIEGGKLGHSVARFLNSNFDRSAEHKVSTAFANNRAKLIAEQLIPAGSKVLDLGCGNGDLLEILQKDKQIAGVGIEMDEQCILSCLEKGVPVLQKDLNKGIGDIQSDSFDFAILNRTIQQIKNPVAILNDMLRVAKRAIVTFPNFGHWSARGSLMLHGRMPKSKELPYEWYDTPNIRLLTVKDFYTLCKKENLTIEQMEFWNEQTSSKILTKLGFKNFGAEQVVAVVSRK